MLKVCRKEAKTPVPKSKESNTIEKVNTRRMKTKDTLLAVCSRYRQILLYGLIGVFVTIIDVIISKYGERFVAFLVTENSGILKNIIKYGLSNTLGVVTGFLIQYFLSARRVFNSQNRRTFAIYVLSFLAGLALSNNIVYFVRTQIFAGTDSNVAFFTAKGLSVMTPFFAMYFIPGELKVLVTLKC